MRAVSGQKSVGLQRANVCDSDRDFLQNVQDTLDLEQRLRKGNDNGIRHYRTGIVEERSIGCATICVEGCRGGKRTLRFTAGQINIQTL